MVTMVVVARPLSRDVDVDEGQPYAHGHGVDAGGYRCEGQHYHRLLLRGRAGVLVFIVVTHAFADHAHTQHQQERKGDPVIPLGDPLGSHRTGEPADEGRDGFDHTEQQADTQSLQETRFLHGGALADGCRKGVSGHRKREENESGEIHERGFLGRAKVHGRACAPSLAAGNVYGLAYRLATRATAAAAAENVDTGSSG